MVLLTEENIEEYLPVLTLYRNRRMQTVIDPGGLERYCPIKYEQADQTPNRQLHTTMGAVDQLPYELLEPILLDLDIQSLYNYRAVNRLSRITVDALRPHKAMIMKAPDTLRAVLSTGIARWIPLQTLYDTVCSSTCVWCGDSAPFIYLLSCSRICYICLQECPLFPPITPAFTKHQYALDDLSIAALPFIRTLPGSYSDPPRLQLERLSLVDSSAAEQARVRLHTSPELMRECMVETNGYTGEPSLTVLQQEDIHRSRRQQNDRNANQASDTLYHDRGANNPCRYMGVVRSPWLDRSTGAAEWGLSCRFCHGYDYGECMQLDWRKVHTRRGFVEHFAHCRRAQTALKVFLAREELYS